MKRPTLLLLLAMPLVANNALWLDLSGEWRIVHADRSEFAKPEFDDSGWSVMVLPPHDPQPLRILPTSWLRKRVPVPAGIDRAHLALTLGALPNSYELYVNGQRVGNTRDRGIDGRLKRPLTFHVPEVDGLELVIAVRCGPTSGVNPTLNAYDRGPWVLSYDVNAPVNAGEQALARLSIENAPALALATIYFAICLISLFSWLADRSRKELLWFALLAIVRCVEKAMFFGGAVADWQVATFEAVGFSYFLSSLAVVLYAEMILAVIGWRGRWLHGLLVVWTLILSLGLASGGESRFVWLIASQFCGSCLILIWLARSSRAQGSRDGPLRLALTLPCVVWIANTAPYLAFRQSGRAYLVYLWGFRWTSYDLAFVVVSSVIMLLLIRRIQLDRREKQRLAAELDAARTVQQMLLPVGPVMTNVEAVYWPAAEVGGDFWQALPASGGGQIIAAGDVSGKGLRAAMIVSVLIGALRNRKSDDPAAILTELNRVAATVVQGGFVTAAVAHVRNGHAIIANAGHPSPYHDGCEVPVANGLPLGIDPDARYINTTAQLTGALTFISDGVVEAVNARGELFGFDRTAAISTQSAAAIAETARAWGQNDDITVVTVRSVR